MLGEIADVSLCVSIDAMQEYQRRRFATPGFKNASSYPSSIIEPLRVRTAQELEPKALTHPRHLQDLPDLRTLRQPRAANQFLVRPSRAARYPAHSHRGVAMQ